MEEVSPGPSARLRSIPSVPAIRDWREWHPSSATWCGRTSCAPWSSLHLPERTTPNGGFLTSLPVHGRHGRLRFKVGNRVARRLDVVHCELELDRSRDEAANPLWSIQRIREPDLYAPKLLPTDDALPLPTVSNRACDLLLHHSIDAVDQPAGLELCAPSRCRPHVPGGRSRSRP